MRIGIIVIVCICSTSLFGQYDLNKAEKYPVLNADSISQVILDSFIQSYNSWDDPEAILDNRYEYFCATIACDRNKEYFTTSGQSALKKLDDRLTEYLRDYEIELKVLKRAKSVVDRIERSDFSNLQVKWNSGFLYDSVRFLVIRYDCNNPLLKFNEIEFHLHIYSENVEDSDIMKVTWIKK